MKTIISLILIIASIGFFVYFTRPRLEELKLNRIEVQKLNEAQGNAKKLKSKIDSLLKDKSSISEADNEKMMRMLPNNVENVKLIIDFDNMLQDLVAQKGTADLYRNSGDTSSGSISIENPKITQTNAVIDGTFDSSQLGVADFSFNVSLTYADFIDFIKRIETSTRIFEIESITFSSPTNVSGTDPSEIVYNFSIALKTYWLKSK